MPTTHQPDAAETTVRARVAHAAAGRDPLPYGQIRKAQDLAADLLATFARHGIPAATVALITNVPAAAVDAIRAATR